MSYLSLCSSTRGAHQRAQLLLQLRLKLRLPVKLRKVMIRELVPDGTAVKVL